jgi:hypothetical protein
MKKSDIFVESLVAHVNRKSWWHVPSRDPNAYTKRGKFFASSFREAEFWGRPLDEPQSVAITKPLIGDEAEIEEQLFGRRVSNEDIAIEERWKLDAKIKRAALRKGYDSILLLAPRAFTEFQSTGKLPRSMELNILNSDSAGTGLKPRQERQDTDRGRITAGATMEGRRRM